jgi:hypothetical protein
MRCSGTARGFGFGSGTVFAAASDRLTLHTNPNAVTSGRTRGTRFQPIGADRVGRRRPCPRHSTHSRQVQNHLSSLRGDQAQSGQLMRGSEGLVLFSSSRSKTTDDLDASFTRIGVLSWLKSRC